MRFAISVSGSDHDGRAAAVFARDPARFRLVIEPHIPSTLESGLISSTAAEADLYTGSPRGCNVEGQSFDRIGDTPY